MDLNVTSLKMDLENFLIDLMCNNEIHTYIYISVNVNCHMLIFFNYLSQ